MIDLSQLAVAAEAFGFKVLFDGVHCIFLGTFKPQQWDGISEAPVVAFVLLDAMERAGLRPEVYLDTKLSPFLPDPQKRVYCCRTVVTLTYGPNRTQAIARQLIAFYQAGTPGARP